MADTEREPLMQGGGIPVFSASGVPIAGPEVPYTTAIPIPHDDQFQYNTWHAPPQESNVIHRRSEDDFLLYCLCLWTVALLVIIIIAVTTSVYSDDDYYR